MERRGGAYDPPWWNDPNIEAIHKVGTMAAGIVLFEAPEKPMLRRLLNTQGAIRIRKDWTLKVTRVAIQERSPLWILIEGNDPRDGQKLSFGIAVDHNIEFILGNTCKIGDGSPRDVPYDTPYHYDSLRREVFEGRQTQGLDNLINLFTRLQPSWSFGAISA